MDREQEIQKLRDTYWRILQLPGTTSPETNEDATEILEQAEKLGVTFKISDKGELVTKPREKEEDWSQS